jgi:hypothetical protein
MSIKALFPAEAMPVVPFLLKKWLWHKKNRPIINQKQPLPANRGGILALIFNCCASIASHL